MHHLNYMGTADAQEVLHRVSREREALESITGRTQEQSERHAFLCEVQQGCETIIGFLNGEYAAFKEAQESPRTDREIFNTN